MHTAGGEHNHTMARDEDARASRFLGARGQWQAAPPASLVRHLNPDLHELRLFEVLEDQVFEAALHARVEGVELVLGVFLVPRKDDGQFVTLVLTGLHKEVDDRLACLVGAGLEVVRLCWQSENHMVGM